MIHSKTWLWMLGAGALAYAIFNRQSIDSGAANLEDTVTAAIAGWKNVGSGPQWIPLLNDAETRYSLPPDLLARIAYQESHFREDIIRGLKTSTAGAEGLMQLEPPYYASVRVPVPYTDADVSNQIEDAAQELVHLYQRFSNWTLAIAAYNAGEGTVHKYGGIPPFTETQNYVAQVMADVPTLA
jgi:peptidoglycan DL-endopeptidase CwlO